MSKSPPAFNVPPIISGFVVLLFVLYLPVFLTGGGIWSFFADYVAFSPKGDNYFWQWVSYAFIHGSFTHLIMNMLWLVVFGTACALRLRSPIRFAILFIAGSIGGALFQKYFGGEAAIMVGASAAISAMMGGAMRFGFQIRPNMAEKAPLLPLIVMLRMPAMLWFLLIWVGLNLLASQFAVTPSGAPISVAWQAHLGGLFVGLLLFGFIEAPPLSPSGGPGRVSYRQWRKLLGKGD